MCYITHVPCTCSFVCRKQLRVPPCQNGCGATLHFWIPSLIIAFTVTTLQCTYIDIEHNTRFFLAHDSEVMRLLNCQTHTSQQTHGHLFLMHMSACLTCVHDRNSSQLHPWTTDACQEISLTILFSNRWAWTKYLVCDGTIACTCIHTPHTVKGTACHLRVCYIPQDLN